MLPKLNTSLVCFVFLFSMGLLAFSANSDAAEEKDKAARRAAQMIRKMKQDMEVEKASMQAQFDNQKKEFEEKLKKSDEEIIKLNKSLTAYKRKVTYLESDIKKITSEKIVLEGKLQQTQINLNDMTVIKDKAQTDLKVNEVQRKTLVATTAETARYLSDCEVKNKKLYEFGTNLVKIYDKPTVYETAMRNEKFTQLKRVELENIFQNYQDKLDSQRQDSKGSNISN